MDTLKGNLRERILAAAIRGVRLYGIEGLRTQHIGQLAGAVPSNIYAYFGGKEELMATCYQVIQRQLDLVFARIKTDPGQVAQDPEEALRQLWTPYWHWLTNHPDETVFYHKYRESTLFPLDAQSKAADGFPAFRTNAALFETIYRIPPESLGALAWLHFLSTTVLYASYVAEGTLENTPETERQVFLLEFHGLSGLLRTAAS